MKRISASLFSIFFCFNTLLIRGQEKELSQQLPNIIIFYADDMGYGDLECYGNPNIRTPHINALAASGIRLTSFYSVAPVCTPSRAGLLTGRYPIRNAPGNFGPNSKNGLPESEITLANILKEKGYQNFAVGKWHLGHLPQYLPTNRGFDEFYGLPYSNDMIRPWVQTDSNLYLYRNTERIRLVNYEQEELTREYTEEAIRMIQSAGETPFFLYLPYSMPHLPVSAPLEFQGKSEGGHYGDVIESIDWSVGEIMRFIESQGKLKNTMVVFSSDNGPWLNLPDRMLQGGVKPWHQGSAGLLKASKATTYEGGMRVPGIISYPPLIPAGQVSSEIACTMDIFATISQLVDANIPAETVIDGMDIMPLLQARQKSPRRQLLFYKGKRLEAIRLGDWKYRYSPHYREEALKEKAFYPELYNLKDDPGERFNRYEEHPETVENMHKLLIKFSGSIGGEMHQP